MFKKFYEWADKIREKLNEKGQGMVEYALILAAVAIIAVVAIWGVNKTGSNTDLQTAITGAFTKAASEVENAQNKGQGGTGTQGGTDTQSGTQGGTQGGTG